MFLCFLLGAMTPLFLNPYIYIFYDTMSIFKSPAKLLTNEDQRRTFADFARGRLGSDILVLTHNNADWDSVSSAAVLSRAMGWPFAINPPSMRGVADGIRKLGFSFLDFPSLRLSDFEGLVLVDGNAKGVFPKSISQDKILLAIDHHKPSNDLPGAKNEIIVPSSESNARIVYELLGLNALDKDMAAALALGIYADTVRFQFVRDPEAFMIFSELFGKSGLKMPEIERLFSPYLSNGEFDSFQHSISSLRTVLLDGIRIAWTIGPIDMKGLVVDRLVMDHPVVIFGSSVRDTAKVSLRLNLIELRANSGFLDASQIMNSVGTKFAGVGGGHVSAAGCTGKGNVDEMINQTLREIATALASR